MFLGMRYLKLLGIFLSAAAVHKNEQQQDDNENDGRQRAKLRCKSSLTGIRINIGGQRFQSLVTNCKDSYGKSSIEMVTASINPEIIPGRISGIMTFRKACPGVAPKSNAASYKFGFICFKRGITAKNRIRCTECDVGQKLQSYILVVHLMKQTTKKERYTHNNISVQDGGYYL